MENASLGKLVLSARLKAGLTLKEFGERFGIPKATLQRTEIGDIPCTATFNKLKDALVELGCNSDHCYRLYEEAYSKRRDRRHRITEKRRRQL